jgi:hypothetical protein
MARFLAPLVALVALAAGIVGALHHHAPGRSHDQCAVCAHGTAPAVVAVVASAPGAPRAHPGRCVVAFAAAPRPRTASTALSRAPPGA